MQLKTFADSCFTVVLLSRSIKILKKVVVKYNIASINYEEHKKGEQIIIIIPYTFIIGGDIAILVSALNVKTGFPKLSQGAKQSVEPISA